MSRAPAELRPEGTAAQGLRLPAAAVAGRAGRLAIAFCAYALVACAIFWPVLRQLDSTVLHEPGDMTSTARDYWAAAQQDTTVFTQSRDALLWAPEGLTRAPALQIANPVQPAFVLLVDGVAGTLGALNLYMLLGFVLSAFAMFVLLDRLGFHPVASFVSGGLFGFSWWQLEQAFFGHIGLNHLWILPLLLLALLRLRERRDGLMAAAVGGLVALAFLLFSYLGLFAATVAALFMLLDLADRRRGTTVRRALLLDGIAWATAYGALFPVLLGAALLPAGFSESFTLTRGGIFGARLSDYVVPSVHHPVLGRLVRGDGFPEPHAGESVVFFGYATIALAVVGAAAWLRARGKGDARAFALRLAIVLVPLGILFSLPAYATVAGRRVPLPDAAYLVGGLTNWWTVYSRFGVLVGFALAILAAAGLTRVLRARRGALILAVVVAVVAFELLPGTPIRTWDVERSPTAAVRSWLTARPGGTVAFYPMVEWWEPLSRGVEDWSSHVWQLVYDQTEHGHPMFAVPSLRLTGSRDQLVRLAAAELNQSWTPGLLATEGVRYVVVNERLYRALGRQPPQLDRGFHRAAVLGEWVVYSVDAAPVPVETALRASLNPGTPTVRYGEGFHAPEPYGAGTARWLGQDGELHVSVPSDRGRHRYVLRLDAFSSRKPRLLEVLDPAGRVLAATVIGTSHAKYTLGPVTLSKPTTLRLRTTPAPSELGDGDTRRASIYVILLALQWTSYAGPD